MMSRMAMIAGAGAAGLTCATYLARAGWNVTVFSNAERTVSNLMLANVIENFPGFRSIRGEELLERMTEQAVSNGVSIVDEGIVGVDAGQKTAVDTEGVVRSYDEFVMATGLVHREFRCDGIDSVPVHQCAVCDGGLYTRDDDVIIIGGGDTAFGDALYLSGIVGKVHVIVRGNAVRASDSRVVGKVMDAPNVNVMMRSSVVGIREADRGHVALVETSDGSLTRCSRVRFDGMFSCIGFDRNVIPVCDGDVWRCGDCVDGASRQAVVAAASGAETALRIIR